MTEESSLSLDLQLLDWGLDLQAAACETCHRRFLVSPAPNQKNRDCPDCHTPTLTTLNEGFADLGLACRPELVIPFKVTQTAAFQSLSSFTSATHFPPADFTAQNLQERLTPLYLPMWLVDARLLAYWEAEAGFQYTVISHVEKYNDITGWQTQETQEPRTRWEPRVGRLNRDYSNIAVPAFDEMADLRKKLGAFDQKEAETYSPDLLQRNAASHPILVRVPDDTPKESWSEAAAVFQQTVVEDCKQASQADQFRQFRWKAKFTNLNWTLLLLPIYQTYYTDDAGEAHSIFINGQTGQISGLRAPSPKRIRQISLTLLAIGIALIIAGLLLAEVLLVFFGVFVIGSAFIPYFLSRPALSSPISR